ncbi:uncharacterized protein MYCFIDRAFT_179443 [Pseudocercospora fijiensis CIRAD86]|uniref:Uncharacterized protein n=1 Tax=Pseudocercospora fijiensis (strain CIRAD86) TaxID=383855 RepID=M3A0Q6_PSEFD|nr:uncharacterized protein MYCFIDRAFT_179443 [Pseudocercospora fijiensis CIRAD86]EME77991.1 hypothetical protein MYCFIDRAFT_179443 [Pseudocercospora fijiensis CIRAD86]
MVLDFRNEKIDPLVLKTQWEWCRGRARDSGGKKETIALPGTGAEGQAGCGRSGNNHADS